MHPPGGRKCEPFEHDGRTCTSGHRIMLFTFIDDREKFVLSIEPMLLVFRNYREQFRVGADYHKMQIEEALEGFAMSGGTSARSLEIESSRGERGKKLFPCELFRILNAQLGWLL